METNFNEKYNFKVSMNQFGEPQENNFFDRSEEIGIKYFEDICLKLKAKNKKQYSILELGSNQCYYTIMFNAILGKDKVKTYILEPNDEYLQRSIKELKLNNIEYKLINQPIGDYWIALNHKFNNPSITIDEIFKDFIHDELDLLHCDIDGAEVVLFEGCEQTLQNKKINYIFMFTHGQDKHELCKKNLNKFNYNILIDHTSSPIGADHLLIARKHNNE